MITCQYLDKNEVRRFLPQLFSILHGNMSVIAPTGNTYEQDYALWSDAVAPAMQKENRHIVLIFNDDTLIGYLQYYTNETTFMIEEAQIRSAFQDRGVIRSAFGFVAGFIPSDVRYAEAYANKKNTKSQTILEHHGFARIGENKNGNSYHYRADCQAFLCRIREKISYQCKIASLNEMDKKWDYEIAQHPGGTNWIIWKEEAISDFRAGRSIPYYGILDGTIICEATAMLDPASVQNSAGMMDETTVYLCAFRTIKEYRGKGYFSKLMRFMLNDLKQKGYTKAVLGVEPGEEKNKAMYQHWGFTEYIKTATEQYPDGTVIDVEYYERQLQI